MDYETGEVYCVQEEQYMAIEFLSILEKVMATYKGKRIAMILDSARIRQAKLIQPFLDEHKSFLTLVFLSPYSPTHNMIEEIFGWLKLAMYVKS
ncbi:transposase [Sporosarcina sp. E16_8]|uniref:transposase n=1 Tax=Sporosarcina sp. E16_8 TaxID=2789295 RepID=UPI001A9275E2|nr:transposase [Sporosarcina sp. E16_8]MBO0588152.1 transposase [Sporosarcina sp. E16_8]